MYARVCAGALIYIYTYITCILTCYILTNRAHWDPGIRYAHHDPARPSFFSYVTSCCEVRDRLECLSRTSSSDSAVRGRPKARSVDPEGRGLLKGQKGINGENKKDKLWICVLQGVIHKCSKSLFTPMYFNVKSAELCIIGPERDLLG